MAHPALKAAEARHFQLGEEDSYEQHELYNYTKTNEADRRDMFRMGKPQEMRVRQTNISSLTIMTTNALDRVSAQLQVNHHVWLQCHSDVFVGSHTFHSLSRTG